MIFKIEGLRCASCAAAIEKALKKAGASEAIVNLASEKLSVNFEKNPLTNEQIIALIKKEGFIALPITKEKRKQTKDNVVLRVILIGFFALTLFLLSFFNLDSRLLGLIGLALSLPVLILSRKYLHSGLNALIKLRPNMDSLILISVTTAFLYSSYGIITAFHSKTSFHFYFETLSMILFFLNLGKMLESISKKRTRDALDKLEKLMPQTALRMNANGQTELVDIEMVKLGDILLVKESDRFPLDGIIVEGECFCDQSLLTGESEQKHKTIGDQVVGASINKNGMVKYRVTAIGSNTVLSQIIKLIEEAQLKKAPIARIADRVCAFFVPFVLAIAAISLSIWLISGLEPNKALSIFMAVLTIACPCALGLATPTAIMVSTGEAALKGILIKGGEPLEAVCKTRTIVFDKTGTLTLGRPHITKIIEVNGSKERIAALAAAAEQGSKHPYALAIKEYCNQNQIDIPLSSEFQSFSGEGISAIVNQGLVHVGSLRFIKGVCGQIDDKIIEDFYNGSGALVALDKSLIGIILIEDELKPDAIETISQLKNMKIDSVMLSGDNERACQAIGAKLKIDKIYSLILPAGKAEVINAIKAQNEGNVAMVGDGINDAVALNEADIGIALASGSDIAIDSADIVISKLSSLTDAIKISKRTMRTIKQNLFWAFFYNLLGLPFAAGVFFALERWLLNPMYAALAMALSSLCVVLNSLRLKLRRRKSK